MLLGIVALRAGTKIHDDGTNMRVTNSADANQYLTREYRQGWAAHVRPARSLGAAAARDPRACKFDVAGRSTRQPGRYSAASVRIRRGRSGESRVIRGSETL